MRHDPEQPLDNHQLSAMAHLVFPRGKQHFEAALIRMMQPLRILHAFGRRLIREGFEEGRELARIGEAGDPPGYYRTELVP